jgi:hypothetical protein
MEENHHPVRVEPSQPIDSALKGLRQFMFEAIYNGAVCQAETQQGYIHN